jgi:YVTN family beta-propeller protein
MKKHLYSKLKVLVLNGFTCKSGLFVLAVLFCFRNDLIAGIKPPPGYRKNHINSSVTIASPTISVGTVTGFISACAGMASVSPHIQQFTAFGNGLTANITIAAPTGFQVSLAAGSGYSSNITISQSGGVASAIVYVRSAASAPAGNIAGNVIISTAGAASQNVPVAGVVSPIPTVSPVPNQTLNNGAATTAINFTGSGGINWVNNTPGIGLAASGSGNIPSFTAINTGTSPITATITVTPVSPGFAYIANTASNSVSVINTATNTVVTTIPAAGLGPQAVSVSPNGRTVYVTNGSPNNLFVIPGTVLGISTATNTVIDTLIAPAASGVAVGPDGTVYVTTEHGNRGFLLSSSAPEIQVGSFPSGVAVSPDGAMVYVANPVDNTVSVINTTPLFQDVVATVAVGISPNGLSVSPDGSRVYVANAGSVSVINTTSNTVIATIPTGGGPAGGILVTPDGSRVYVAGGQANIVSVINTATNAVVATIPVSGGPLGVSVTPDGSRVYVTDNQANNVSVINTATNTIVATIPVGHSPSSVGNFITGVGCTGAPVTFTITVNPASVHDASLSNLTVSNGSLTPSFASATTSYIDTVSNISSLIVTPTTNNTNATVKINGSIITRGSSASIPLAAGQNIVTAIVTAADGTTTKTYTLTVTLVPYINAGVSTGTITACAGSASISPNILQFPVSGSALTANITVTAPTNFEVSLAPGSGYGSNVTLIQSGGVVNPATVYVRSASSAPTGTITGNVMLTSAGALSQNVTVTGFVNALPTVNPVSNQTVINGATTTAVNFTGSGGFNWVNNTPGIGLAASGSGNIPSFTAINSGSAPITATITVTPVSTATGYAYIPNHNSNNVSVINTTTNTVVATIPVGIAPFGVAASPDGSTVYVSNSGDTFISLIDTKTNTVVNTMDTGVGAFGLVVAPDGSKLYAVIAYDPAVSSAYVFVFNIAFNEFTNGIPIPANCTGIAISPDGSRVYVANSGSGSVIVINAASNTVIATVPVGQGPIAMAVSLDGKKIFVTNSGSNNVSVIDAATNTVVSNISTPPSPNGIVLSPNGSMAYVANSSPSVTVFNTSSNAIVAAIPVSSGQLYGISISRDGSRVYAADLSGNVAVINTATNTVVATIPVGALPYSLGNFVTGTAACSGTPVTFTITVNPSNLANANLTSLKLSNGKLSPNFASDTTNYTAIVPNAVTSITVTPTAADSSAVITVNGATVASGSPSASIPLSVGPNIITTVVTANSTSKTYTVIVTRRASDYAFLANLEISKGNLKPDFAWETFAYTARVSRTTFEITATPTAGNAFATIKVNGITVASGTASPPIALSNGINDITIVVTAQNGTNTKTYTLTVTKEPAPQNSIYQTTSFNSETSGADSLADGIKVHLGISPNGDGINDILVIDGITAYPENKLLIMNSSGALVFETLGYDNSTRVFDGHSNKNGSMQLPGTYFYSLEYKVGKEKKYNSGFFILKY